VEAVSKDERREYAGLQAGHFKFPATLIWHPNIRREYDPLTKWGDMRPCLTGSGRRSCCGARSWCVSISLRRRPPWQSESDDRHRRSCSRAQDRYVQRRLLYLPDLKRRSEHTNAVMGRHQCTYYLFAWNHRPSLAARVRSRYRASGPQSGDVVATGASVHKIAKPEWYSDHDHGGPVVVCCADGDMHAPIPAAGWRKEWSRPSVGRRVVGNGHLMNVELNSDQIAQLPIDWLGTHGL